MAGSYPDAGGRRMGYDKDGSILWHAYPVIYGQTAWSQIDTTTITALTEVQKGDINDEDPNSYYNLADNGPGGQNTDYFALIFPELRDITGIHLYPERVGAFTGMHVYSLQTSANTTNGVDGTWTTHWSEYPQTWDSDYTPSLQYRSAIESMTATSVRALRWVCFAEYRLTGNLGKLYSFHLYGNISASSDRLAFVDDTTGVELTELEDWGDVPRGTVLTRTFKIKNLSATKTATTNTLYVESLYGTSNTWYTMKEGAGAYASPLTLTSPLSPGASTGTITIKQSVGDTAQLSLAASRLYVTVGTWS